MDNAVTQGMEQSRVDALESALNDSQVAISMLRSEFVSLRNDLVQMSEERVATDTRVTEMMSMILSLKGDVDDLTRERKVTQSARTARMALAAAASATTAASAPTASAPTASASAASAPAATSTSGVNFAREDTLLQDLAAERKLNSFLKALSDRISKMQAAGKVEKIDTSHFDGFLAQIPLEVLQELDSYKRNAANLHESSLMGTGIMSPTPTGKAVLDLDALRERVIKRRRAMAPQRRHNSRPMDKGGLSTNRASARGKLS